MGDARYISPHRSGGFIRDEWDETVSTVHPDIVAWGVHSASPERSEIQEYVKLTSPKLKALEELNAEFEPLFKKLGGYHVCAGKATIFDSDSIPKIDRIEALRKVARNDVSRLERLAVWAHDMPDLRREYLERFRRICDGMHTPESAISPNYTYGEFYYEEEWLASLQDRTKYQDSVEESLVMVVHWDRLSEYKRKNPGVHVISMDPPWGTHKISYSLAEIDDAIRYGRAHGRGFGISDKDASDVIQRADGRCALCGRTTNECGLLSAHSLAPVFSVHIVDDGPKKPKYAPDPLVRAVCQDCARSWQTFVRDEKDVNGRRYEEDMDPFMRRFHEVVNRQYMSYRNPAFKDVMRMSEDRRAKEAALFAEFEAYASKFCKDAIKAGLPPLYVPGGNYDGDGRSVSERLKTTDETSEEFKRDHPLKHRWKVFRFNLRWNSFQRTKSRLRRIKTSVMKKFNPEYDASEAFYAKLRRQHAKAHPSGPAPESLCPDKMSALATLNEETKAKSMELPFYVDIPDEKMDARSKEWYGGGYARLKTYAKAHPDEVRRYADAALNNKKLADEYAERFRAILLANRIVATAETEDELYEAYKQERKLEEAMFSPPPVRCYFVATAYDGKGHSSSCACSLERMCEVAGLGRMLGTYKPRHSLFEKRYV